MIPEEHHHVLGAGEDPPWEGALGAQSHMDGPGPGPAQEGRKVTDRQRVRPGGEVPGSEERQLEVRRRGGLAGRAEERHRTPSHEEDEGSDHHHRRPPPGTHQVPRHVERE